MRRMTRPLFISGFMATGKSAVGRLLAEKSGASWFDLDQEVERSTGRSVAQLFEERGEAAFRRLEQEALRELLKQAESKKLVVSLGGGALLDREFRVEMLGRAVVVSLSASPEEILRRVQAQDCDAPVRPLLAGSSPGEKVRALLEQRRSSYLESHGVVATEGRELADIAAELQRIWALDAVAVAAGEESYSVRIGSGLIRPQLGEVLGKPSGTLLVTDTNVNPLHGEKARAALTEFGAAKQAEAILTPGEEHKNLQGLSQILQAAFDGSLDRKATFVGLGGGVVTDMTGFAAATWVRGVNWVGLPTTLLSMVDASVGGKTAVDFHTAKNSVGAFWQPQSVICDVETLLTETDRAYTGALSEVVKTALIGDAELLGFLEQNAEAVLRRDLSVATEIVRRCVAVKARIVALDERESGIRATLNLGHTIGHALESSGGFTALTHGEAVSLGLVAALRLGQKKGHTPEALAKRVLSLLVKLKLPHSLSRAALEKSVGLLGHDKKRAGSQIRFVYALGEGNVVCENIALSELEALAPSLADD